MNKIVYFAQSMLLSVFCCALTGTAFAQNTEFKMAVKPAQPVTIELAKNARTRYVIALANDAIPAEKTAAVQLQKYLQQVTGAGFTIKAEGEVAPAMPQILVGAGSRVKSLLPRQNWSSLGQDGIVIKTSGDKLILAGGRPRGTLYAVFQFLENNAGCRWWTPTENHIPIRKTLTVKPQNIVYRPPFDRRELYASGVLYHPEFATIMRQNGTNQPQEMDWGGHHNVLGFVHTFDRLLPVGEYFPKHPDWYSDPANGNFPGTVASKVPGNQESQLCMTNPAVRDELTKRALEWIRKSPEAGAISITTNDNNNYCRCPECSKLFEKEGSQAGPLLSFVNDVTERINREYPHFLVQTLAYAGTEKLPKYIRPGKNVIIELAPLSADFGHPLNSDWNKEARTNFMDWRKISNHMAMWSYVVNFNTSTIPHPNWSNIGADLRFFAAHKLQGVLEQSENYTGGVSDHHQLRTWVISKLLWDPSQDQDRLITEFTNGYFGPAGVHIKRYIEMVHRAFLAQNRKLQAMNEEFSFMTLDVMNEAERHYALAAAAVENDPVLSQRVRRERLSVDLAWLMRYKTLKKTAAKEGKPFLGPADPLQALDAYAATARSFGVKKYSEAAQFEDKLPGLRSMLQEMLLPQAELPEFARAFPEDDVIDIQQNDFFLYNVGQHVDLVDDPAASDKKAARLRGASSEWAIQARLGKFLTNPNDRYRVYAMVRVQPKAGLNRTSVTGTGTLAGIYDFAESKEVASVERPATELVADEYRPVDLGVHPLNAGMYVWLAGNKNADVEGISVDRVILLRQHP